jgi:hypothetical protein
MLKRLPPELRQIVSEYCGLLWSQKMSQESDRAVVLLFWETMTHRLSQTQAFCDD